MLKPKALPPKALINPCNPKTLSFTTTNDLPSLEKIIGQPRAIRTLEMGSKVSGLGFNIFVSGIPDSGRTTLTRDYIKQKAVNEPVPDAWCYVNNFANPYRPNAINLPAGQVMVFKEDIRNFINRCRQEIWKTFHKDEYVSESKSLAKALEKAQEAEFEKLQRAAKRVNFAIISTASGFDLTPLIESKPISPEEVEKLPQERRDELQQVQDKLEKKALETILKVREIGEDYYKKFIDLNRHTALFAIDYLV